MKKLFLLSFLFATLASCGCDEDNPALKNLRICDVHKDDLDGFQCDDDMPTLSNEAPFITASVEVYHPFPTDRIIFRMLDEGNGGSLVTELNIAVSELTSEVEGDECLLRAAASVPKREDVLWPDADLSFEVMLDNGTDQILLNKKFSIR